MPVDLSEHAVFLIAGAFLLGWLLASLNARFGKQSSSGRRDPREKQILSLEAELRVARTEASSALEKFEAIEATLNEITEGIEKRDNVIAHQQETVTKLKKDLKDSVAKVRQLRSELSERATESVRSEAKLREVETELSVVQASSDLIATGVLDFSVTPDGEDADGDESTGKEQRAGA